MTKELLVNKNNEECVSVCIMIQNLKLDNLVINKEEHPESRNEGGKGHLTAFLDPMEKVTQKETQP